MRTLKKDNVNSNDLFLNVIGSWLDIIEPTSAKLANALDNCGLKRIAEKIGSKLLSYCDMSTCTLYTLCFN